MPNIQLTLHDAEEIIFNERKKYYLQGFKIGIIFSYKDYNNLIMQSYQAQHNYEKNPHPSIGGTKIGWSPMVKDDCYLVVINP